MPKSPNDPDQLKLEIAELIGELKGGSVIIDGNENQAIINVPALNELLRKIMKVL